MCDTKTNKNQKTNLKIQGFSLIELLIAITIIGILLSIVYPNYTHYLARVRRTEACLVLHKLAASLEDYYQVNNSYQGATLSQLNINATTQGDFYTINIDSATDQNFQISAIPQKQQAKIESACGTLILDDAGTKKISGKGNVEECWSGR